MSFLVEVYRRQDAPLQPDSSLQRDIKYTERSTFRYMFSFKKEYRRKNTLKTCVCFDVFFHLFKDLKVSLSA